MRKLLTILLAAFLIASVAAPPVAAGAAGATGSAVQAEATCEYPVELTDATGEDVTLDEPPERVVALQASDAQTVFEIGAEESLVGMPINDFTAHHDAGDRTNVAVEGELSVDVETVVDLEPDVVLAANVTVPEDVEQLREAGITVYHFDTAEDLEDVRENVRRTGQLTGACDGAQERIDWMDERLGALETALEGVERPTAYWSMSEGSTAGEGTFQNEILEAAGVDNLAAEAGLAGWQEISNEVVIEEDPEWIVYGAADPDAEPMLSEGAMETTASQEGNLVAVDSNAVSQPAPHVVHAIETIVEAVHPEAYEESRAILEEGNESDENATEENATDANTTETNATNDSTDEEANETAESNESANESTGVGENATENASEENATDGTDDADEETNATDENDTDDTDDNDDAENATDPGESAESDDGDSIPVGIVAAVVAAIAVIAAAVVGFRRL